MNGSVNSISFSPDGRHLYSFGGTSCIISTSLSTAAASTSESTRFVGDGEVYVWEMSTLACVHRFRDDGCLHGTVIGTDPSHQFLACG